MCTICGCGENDYHHHSHAHPAGGHAHGPPDMDISEPGQSRIIRIERDILAKNAEYAAANRARFAAAGITALNLMSSPGSGKTALLVRTISDLRDRHPIAVIEGDQQTSNDAERIRATGAPAVQINTGKGCHLDAHGVGHALDELSPPRGTLLFIENVGNLVCPAAFDLGEASRIVVFSVTEGEDKPIKYPDMFAAADLLLINKADLIPYLDFDLGLTTEYARRVNPGAEIFVVSARTGAGMADFYGWIARQAKAPGAAMRVVE